MTASGYTQAQLDALTAALASGELRVSYEGHSVEYRSIADLERAIQIVRDGLLSDAGTPRSRMLRAYSNKGI